MTYDQILGLLAQFNLYAWIITSIVCLVVWQVTQTGGWGLIMFGSVFVVLRQLWKFLPGYKPDQASEVMFNEYMIRYVFGAIGALLICVGFLMLIINYHVLKSRLEED